VQAHWLPAKTGKGFITSRRNSSPLLSYLGQHEHGARTWQWCSDVAVVLERWMPHCNPSGTVTGQPSSISREHSKHQDPPLCNVKGECHQAEHQTR